MSSFFSRLTPNQRLWGAIGGVIVGGSFVKVGYFRLCRTMMVEQSNQSHIDATEHYREAKEFAKWSAKDREERRAEMPPLTRDQELQMKAYLRVMQEHHAFNPDSDLDSGN